MDSCCAVHAEAAPSCCQVLFIASSNLVLVFVEEDGVKLVDGLFLAVDVTVVDRGKLCSNPAPAEHDCKTTFLSLIYFKTGSHTAGSSQFQVRT
jgi:hypothetical protein